MPFEMSWDTHAVTVRFSGHLSAAEFMDGARLMGEDPRFDDLRFIVNDFRDVASHDIDVGNTLEPLVVAGIGGAATNAAVRVAVIAEDPKIAGLVRAFQQLVGTEGPQVSLFDRAEHAREWMLQQKSASRWQSRSGL